MSVVLKLQMNYSRKLILSGRLKRTIAYICCVLAFNCCYIGYALAEQNVISIEIISAGKKYPSFEDYKRSADDLNLMNRSNSENINPENGFKSFPFLVRRQFLNPLPIEALLNCSWEIDKGRFVKGVTSIQDLKKAFNDENFSDLSVMMFEQFLPSFIAMRKIGYNTVITKVIDEFQKSNGSVISYKRLKSSDLEKVLSKSFSGGEYTGPILLISDKKKLRIMTLEQGISK